MGWPCSRLLPGWWPARRSWRQSVQRPQQLPRHFLPGHISFFLGRTCVRGLFIPWLCCWAIQQGCQFFHLADYYIALKREGFILAGCYIDCYRDVSIFTGCYIDWERERGRIAGSCHIDCYRKDLYLSSTSALGSPRQDINANSSAHPLPWVLFV